jgi:uncharacterized membrane protein
VDRVASASGWLRTRSAGLITDVLIRCFIDNTLLHSCWRCHRRRDRSFSVRGRQFHVCARCTGLIVGGAFAWALLPWRGSLLPVCAISLSLLVVDGCTQLWKWRESNNALRLVTGIAVGLTLPPTLIALLKL